MVLVYLPTFARTKSPSHVGKYTQHGAYGYGCSMMFIVPNVGKYTQHIIVIHK